MAIFSLNHSFIGRSKHPPGAASLYARYITRNEACTVIEGARMPIDRRVMAWLDTQEQDDRKNARVIDKLIVALPVELRREQNLELLRTFGDRMTEGRAAWMAAMHDGGDDAGNPHAHIILRDRDPETGKRVMMTTEAGSTERFRQAWEEEVNRALERAGRPERIDRRSLADQGLDREPQLHVGAGAQALAEKHHAFESAEKEITRLINGVPVTVTVNYPVIDEGRTRFEENEERKARNAAREAALEPVRPETTHPSMQAIIDAAARAEALYKQARAKPGEALDESDPVAVAIVREQLAEFHAVRRDREPEPDPMWRPFEFGSGRESRPEPAAPRRGPYPAGPGRNDRGGEPEEPDERISATKSEERQPKRDATSLVAGAGLAFFDRLANSLWSFFEGRSAPEPENEERDMAQENKTRQQIAQEHNAQQQKAEREEAARFRQIELELLLAQRDRERHHDRGR